MARQWLLNRLVVEMADRTAILGTRVLVVMPCALERCGNQQQREKRERHGKETHWLAIGHVVAVRQV